ncbi:hypothetical protein [Thermoflavimicrobium daqui]|jgi:hypothetical protein|uniref:ABC-2 family transporter protein n=1 Tax=Thermoflavimicrobium daqui TaxID=2137476 RepID=A0A364K1Z9_9BACL|nr:hypothetical protein [Thermoflavimicrobium daqui]RAL22054.1 hypothetical protein DL897_14765 [Thermoflavimicrobium daqui]
MNAFWSIVKNDFRMVFPKKYIFPLTSMLIGGTIFGVLCSLLNFTQIKPEIHWVYTWILFALPGFTTGIVMAEEREKTLGWWLSLPYPRHWLIAAKCIAMLLRALQIILILFLFTNFILYLFTWIRPEAYENIAWGELFYYQLMIIGERLIYVPLIITLGLLAGLLTFSSMKLLNIPIWIFFGLFVSFIVLRHVSKVSRLDWDIVNIPLIWIGLFSFLISLLFYYWSISILNRKLQI